MIWYNRLTQECKLEHPTGCDMVPEEWEVKPDDWQPPIPLEILTQAKIVYINASCQAEIIGGFMSSALGAPYVYDTKVEDQANLVQQVMLQEDSDFKCADQDGVKQWHPHRAEQLQQVLEEFTKHKDKLLQRASYLKNQVRAAETEEDLVKISW